MLEIARTLVEAGHETWCVGGAVRDALLGIRHLDWDLATAARPKQVQRLFRRTVPVGIRFGTVGVIDRAGQMHEVTTFRRDVHTDGRHAEVEFGVSLQDDLARRDFTINAMAWDPIGERFEDPFDGEGDLARGLVRAVGTAEARFEEDRLRALRAIRFAARFGFAIEPATWAAIVASAPQMGRLSAERVKQELDKTMEQVERPSEALGRWQESGAFATLLPELASGGERGFAAVDALPRAPMRTRPLRRTLRFAAMLSSLDATALSRTLVNLKCSNLERKTVIALLTPWRDIGDTVGAQLMHDDAPTDLAVRQWVARIGRLRVAAFSRLAAAHWCADMARGLPAPAPRAWRQLHRRMLETAFRDPLEVGDLAIDGDELRRQAVAAGPELGRVLHALVGWVVEDPARNTRPQLLEAARSFAAAPSP